MSLLFSALQWSVVCLLRSTDSMKCDWNVTIPCRLIDLSLLLDNKVSDCCALEWWLTANKSLDSEPQYSGVDVDETEGIELEVALNGGGNGGGNNGGGVETRFDLTIGASDEEQFVDVSESKSSSFVWTLIRLWLNSGIASQLILQLFKGSAAEDDEQVEENELSLDAVFDE